MWETEKKSKLEIISHKSTSSNVLELESSVIEISKIIANGESSNAVSSLMHLLDISGTSLSTLIRHSKQELINTFNFSPDIANRLFQIFKFYATIRKYENAEPKIIKNSSDAYTYMHSRLFGASVERVYGIYLNQANHIIGCQLIAMGGINQAIIDIRVLIRGVLNCLGVGIILVHNHPSGSIKPSIQDNHITLKIKNALKLMDIKLLDHIIYTDSKYYSYADEGNL